jgi:hypothetical protein
MRVLVCGGRDYSDSEYLFQALDAVNPDEICHGGARGADELAGAWAKSRSIKCKVFHADWAKHGKGAGPIRNKQMLVEFKPDCVIAFPGGRGTANMISQAQKAGIPVYVQECEC